MQIKVPAAGTVTFSGNHAADRLPESDHEVCFR